MCYQLLLLGIVAQLRIREHVRANICLSMLVVAQFACAFVAPILPAMLAAMTSKRHRVDDEASGDNKFDEFSVVELNVGGKKFETRMGTLLCCDYFRALFSFADKHKEERFFFVDRDPRRSHKGG